MWHTSEGDRILEGAEAALFKAGVTSLVEQIKDEANFGSFHYTIELFANLTWSQRLAVIETLATHLLTQTAIAPRLTAVNEAAIGSVFEHISFMIDMEIMNASAQNMWRSLLLNAAHEAYGELTCDDDPDVAEDLGIPESADCSKRDHWHALVHSMSDRVLWDRDFEMMDEFLDEPPEKSALLRQIMGIDDEYFSTAAEDLNTLEDVGETLHRLTEMLK